MRADGEPTPTAESTRPLFQPNEFGFTVQPKFYRQIRIVLSSQGCPGHPDQSDIFIVPMLTLDRAIRRAWQEFPPARLSLDHILSAIGGQRRSGDETGFLGDEKNHASGDFFWFAQPTHRNEWQDRLFQNVGRNGLDHVGCYITGADSVDGDPLAGVFLASDFVKPMSPAFEAA